MHSLSLAIVGADYPNKRGPTRRFDLALCTPGEPLQLVPEPNNSADEHAVAVFSSRDVQLGYIPSERAVLIGKWLREGREMAAIFQAHASFGGWLRLAFDGEQPMLPPASQSSGDRHGGGDETNDGFWPDPIYDD